MKWKDYIDIVSSPGSKNDTAAMVRLYLSPEVAQLLGEQAVASADLVERFCEPFDQDILQIGSHKLKIAELPRTTGNDRQYLVTVATSS